MELVSVLMPVYNCQDYVKESIDSILEQTYTNFELLIVDDCSTDKTAELILSYRDKRIRFYQNEINKGITKTLNFAIPLCRGRFIARMDGDDIAHSERIEKQVTFFEQNTDYGLVGCWYLIKNNYTKKADFYKRHTMDEKIRFHMLFGNQFLHPGIMIRKHILHKLKYHDVPTSEDYDLWVRVLKYCKVANLPEVLMVYRWHGENISIKNQQGLRKSVIGIISRLLTEYQVEHTHQELLLQVMVALSLPKEHFVHSGKLEELIIWFRKLSASEALVNRFGKDALIQEMSEYYALYEVPS